MRAFVATGRISTCIFNPPCQMSLFKNLSTLLLLGVLVAFFLAASAANAAEGGGKDGLHARLEPIVANLLGPDRKYIQVEMTLKLAKPEVTERVKLYMPVIRHRLILLLTGKDANQLGPTEGKQKLIQESKNAVNQALELTDKEGVTDVLLDSFIIQ